MVVVALLGITGFHAPCLYSNPVHFGIPDDPGFRTWEGDLCGDQCWG